MGINSYTRGLMVELACHHFGAAEPGSQLTKNAPPAWVGTDEERAQWAKEQLETMVDKYVLPAWSGAMDRDDASENVGNDTHKEYIILNLSNGTRVRVPVATKQEHVRTKEADAKKNYFHSILESGAVYMLLQKFTKEPVREELLALFKLIGLILRGHSTQLKYPLEILYLFFQQYSTMNERDACVAFSSCFVNLNGNGHVAADQLNEWVVKIVKKLLKHMYSNKTNDNIYNQSAALAGVNEIVANLDGELATVARYKQHKYKLDVEQEMKLIGDFHEADPFTFIEGRKFRKFPNISMSPKLKVDSYHMNRWFSGHKKMTVPAVPRE